jgi:4-amino-4-deoxy-L-arabinose transferase-like glycosyltransferase
MLHAAGARGRGWVGKAIALLILLRAVMAAILPLSADEAYYLLWSQHLQLGYYDHPPAIAFLIRVGTLVFGETPLGVRAAGILLSLPATYFVWNTASLLLKNERKAARAALFFNLTLMAAVEMMVATPDMPSIVTVAAFVWAVAKVQASQDGRWWLAAGVAAGLSLLSKYSALFVGLGILVWLLADPRARLWLKTVWPWAAGAIALLIFTPHLIWQSQHGWMTFAFQFGRVGGGGLTARYLIELVGSQLGLATPFILVLGGMGFWQARKPGDDRFLLFVPVAVALLYFLQHALHDRVQGNWPCFVYPMLAILAAEAAGNARKWLAVSAAPVAAVLLLAVYVQVTLGWPLKNDPAARLLARDFPQAARALAQSTGTVVTSDYQTTALLRHYQPQLKVVQINDPQRYLWAPDTEPLVGQVVYFVEKRRARPDLVEDKTQLMSDPLDFGAPGNYVGYLLHAPKDSLTGKVP